MRTEGEDLASRQRLWLATDRRTQVRVRTLPAQDEKGLGIGWVGTSPVAGRIVRELLI